MPDLRSLTDEQLADAMKCRDDGEALMELRRRYEVAIESYLRRRINNHPDAVQIRDSVWDEVWDRRGSYDPSHTFESGLWTITRWRLIDWLRRVHRGHVPNVEEPRMDGDLMDWIETIAVPHKDLEFKLRFWRAWERLPIEYQDMLKWRFHDELTQVEIAERLDRSVPFVRKRERLARALLKRYLAAEGIDVD